MKLEELPPERLCNGCSEVKPAKDFRIKRKRIKTGWTYNLNSDCRKCEGQRRRSRAKEDSIRRDWVAGKPLLDYIESVGGLPEYIPDSVCKRYRDLRSGKAQQIGIDTVDRIFVMMHVPWKLNELYPLDSE